MPKKKTIAPPATDTSKPVEAEVIEPEKPKPKPEPPIELTPEQRIQQLESNMQTFTKQVETALNQLVDFVKPLAPLREQSLANQQAQEAGVQDIAAKGGGGTIEAIAQLINSPLARQILGGGENADTEIIQLSRDYTKQVLVKGINDLKNPPPDPYALIGKSLVENYVSKIAVKAATDAVPP